MRVLVADDHSLFRDGIVSLLEAAGHEVVQQVGDGERALEAAEKHQPDLVLMDIAMPKQSGLETLRLIKQRSPTIKVVMLTVSEDEKHLMEAAQAGADGYLLKNLEGEQFLKMLEGLALGEAAITRKTAARLLQRLSRPEQEVEADDPTPLTKRETELLTLVAQGMSNRQIAAHLSISENTVKYHLKNIIQKLQVSNRTEAVTVGIRRGIVELGSAAKSSSQTPTHSGS